MFDLSDVTTSISEPFSLATLKTYLRVPTANTTDDTDLTALITAGRKKFEDVTWRSVVPHDYELVWDMTDTELDLPYIPIDSVSAIYYWDGEEWEELDTSDDYYVFGDVRKRVIFDINTGYRLKIVYSTLGDDSYENLNLIKEWIAAVYYNRPDVDGVEQKVIDKMIKMRVNVCL